MGNFFSLRFSKKGDDEAYEHKKLAEGRSAATYNAVGKTIYEPFSQKTSGVAIPARKENRRNSTSALLTNVGDGMMITFETTPVRYAIVQAKEPPHENTMKYGNKLNDLDFEFELMRKNIFGLPIAMELVRMREGKPKHVSFYCFFL